MILRACWRCSNLNNDASNYVNLCADKCIMEDYTLFNAKERKELYQINLLLEIQITTWIAVYFAYFIYFIRYQISLKNIENINRYLCRYQHIYMLLLFLSSQIKLYHIKKPERREKNVNSQSRIIIVKVKF